MKTRPAKNTLSDGDLLRRSTEGDEEAFLILYRRHQGPVFRFALHMAGSRELAEEVTQDVFMAIVTDARQYRAERGTLQAYLIGVARNQVRRHLRSMQTIADSDAGERSMARDPGEHLDETLGKQEDLKLLRRAILNLPPNYREAIVLCDLEGFDYAQAAEQLGCALGTIRSRLHRARGILQRRLKRRQECPV
ncbi:MAG: RNA polymerase sigma factor [Acidobacteriaceae bacterium]|nr:RNA polymerase sigma factor [Acidobacteriaceae bacterium]